MRRLHHHVRRSEHGRNRVLKFKGVTHPLSAGLSDDVVVWRSAPGDLVVLSVNSRMGYVGLERFSDGYESADDSLFSQKPEEDFDREDFFDLSPATMRNLLLEHML